MSPSLQRRWQLAGALAFKHLPGLGVSEGSNHGPSVTQSISNVNRYYRDAQPNTYESSPVKRADAS